MNNPKRIIRDFELILLGLDELTPDVTERLYEAGLDDALLCARKGGVTAGFDREAESFEQAVTSAMADVRKADVGVTGFRLVHPDIAVSLAEVARRIGKTRQAVSLYARGKRGPGSFPAPVSDLNDEPLYDWSDVAHWLGSHGLMPDEIAREAGTRSRIYHTLEAQYRAHESSATRLATAP